MDRYNFQINRVYRDVLNERFWEWRLFTETVTTATAGIFSLPTLYDQIHSILDDLPTTSPDAELSGFVEDRTLRTLTFKDNAGVVDTTHTTIRVKFFKITTDLDTDASVPIFPTNFHNVIYHGVLAHQLERLGESRRAADHGARFREMMKKLRVHDVTSMFKRHPPDAVSQNIDVNNKRIEFEET